MAVTRRSDALRHECVDMGDLGVYPTRHVIRAVRHDPAKIRITWDDGRVSLFHGVWLRDNCPCTACRHPQTMERVFQVIDHPCAERILVAVIEPRGALTVTFGGAGTPAHESHFDAGWLRHHCYNDESLRERRVDPRLWAAADVPRISAFRHEAVMHDDEALEGWLSTLLERGVTLIEEMPAVLGTVQRLAERVGPLRTTNFGMVFEVESKPDPNNAAYTAMGLEPHTDIPNVPYPPSVQLLHCIRNDARGGGSILVDGFRVAEELRRESEADFRILTDEHIEFRFHDAAVDLRHRAPVLTVDSADRVIEVRFSNWLRAALDVPQERVEAYYGALLHYWALLRETRFQLRPRLAPGQAIVFDNQRVLHGREPFDPSTGGRLLQGCYLDREIIESRRRLLARASGRRCG